MCGIYGTTKRYSADTIQAKLNSIQFRGPDHSAYKVISHQVIFGHNRLAIIDIDPRSNQPFQYQNIWVVFNGEIYNFKKIKETLQAKGYTFQTSSDTEVLAAAYLAYGKDCVHHFNGMFAFVLYDAKKQELFGARDRLGQKPFYYTLNEGHFEFGSQIYPLSIANNYTIDQTSIQQYLHYQCIVEPNSIYQEIKKLKAGHCFRYDLTTRQFKDWKYWDINNYQPFEGTYTDAKEELSSLLKSAVAKRMNADVPLGVFLSGGIDSSLVAAISQSMAKQPIKTFAVKFQEKGYDESKYARKVAQILQTNHTEIPCNYDECIPLIENLSNSYQEPFADSSALPTLLLSKHTRKYVTVALSGDAGDESFIGYNRYDFMRKAAPIYAFPKSVRNLVSKGLEFSNNRKLQSAAKGINFKDINQLYLKQYTTLADNWRLAPNVGLDTIHRPWVQSEKKLLERISDFDLKVYLGNGINTKVDRASMAYSLEVRAPLEDHNIIAFARSLPTHYKYQNGIKKRILKDILYDYIPKKHFDRPKMGFGMPLAIWFRGRLKDYLFDTLSEKNLAAIPNLNIPKIKHFMLEHQSGKANRFPVLWSLIVLVNWLKKNGK